MSGPALSLSWGSLPSETLREPLLEGSKSGRLQKAAAAVWLLRLLIKDKLKLLPHQHELSVQPPQSSLLWLGFSMPPWLVLKRSVLVQGEKGKGDLAVGGEHPQAGHQACHLAVKSQLGPRLARFPPALSWTWHWGTRCLHLPCKCLSFPVPCSSIPTSLPVW